MRLLPRAALRARMELRYYKFCNIHFILLTAELCILLAIKNNEYIFALYHLGVHVRISFL